MLPFEQGPADRPTTPTVAQRHPVSGLNAGWLNLLKGCVEPGWRADESRRDAPVLEGERSAPWGNQGVAEDLPPRPVRLGAAHPVRLGAPSVAVVGVVRG